MNRSLILVYIPANITLVINLYNSFPVFRVSVIYKSNTLERMSVIKYISEITISIIVFRICFSFMRRGINGGMGLIVLKNPQRNSCLMFFLKNYLQISKRFSSGISGVFFPIHLISIYKSDMVNPGERPTRTINIGKIAELSIITFSRKQKRSLPGAFGTSFM